MKNNNKILLVDGSNLLFQMFFGMPARIVNGDGVGVWGVIGFIGALRKIILQTTPTHVAVLFDGEHENKRRDLDANYKANRTDYSDVADEENPYSQLPHIYHALKYLHISYAETTVCEVDDWVAGYVKHFGEDNEIIISSFDSDFFQLITRNVSVLRYRGDKSVVWNFEYFVEKYGIEPRQYADFKSLVGDKADNIEGAQMVGMKTAGSLLREFGSLDNILVNAESIQKAPVRESIRKSSLRLVRNYKMIKLTGNESIPISLEDMVYPSAVYSTNEVLRGIGLL